MKKTFRELLAERDDEFTYFIKSTADIHRPELFERVRMTLMPYRIKEIKTDSYQPWTKENRTFPDQPNTATYSIKVITGLPVDTKRVLETMAMMCHIHISHLNMAPEDDVQSKLVGKPEQVDKTTSQLLVGSKRIGEFMRELQKDRRDRENKSITREVYESFFTTHRGLETVIKKPIRKGYYMIEMAFDQDENQTYMHAEGPFPDRPDGNLYRDTISARNVMIVTESDDGPYKVQAIVEKIAAPVGDQVFRVPVSDMVSGRTFTSMVRAATPEIAREVAVHQVAEANRLDPSGLTAMAPKPSASATG